MHTTADQNSVRAAYERWHGDRPEQGVTDAPWHALVKKNLAPEDVAGKQVLEIACGGGGLACWLAALPRPPARIVAADFSAAAVRKARALAAARNLGGIAWEIGDIQSLAHPPESFDVVISCETIEHVPEPLTALRELRRVLKPGGKLLLTTPNYLGPMGLYRAYVRLRGRPFTEEGQPINRFMTLPGTRRLLARAGLRVRTIDGEGHYIPFPGRAPIRIFRPDNWRHPFVRRFGLHSFFAASRT